MLSLDGGGLKGIFAVTILTELEKRCGRPLYEVFDFIVGTSTGGLIALALGVRGHSAEECGRLYGQLAEAAFQKRAGAVGCAQQHREEALERELRSMFGDAKLDQTDEHPTGGQCKVAVVAVSANQRPTQPVLFKNYSGTEPSEDRQDVAVWQAARATSASPQYFAPVRIDAGGSRRMYQDGALAANNPALLGYSEVLKIPGWQGRDVVVVSIGDAVAPRAVNGSRKPSLNAASTLPDVIRSSLESLEASSAAVHRVMRGILPGSRYFRIDAVAAVRDVDGRSGMPTWSIAARQWLSDNADELDQILYCLR